MSKTTILTLIVSCFVVLSIGHEQERGWGGLVPLQSTRADVERMLGRSKDPCNCVYKTDENIVVVEYSKGSCKGNLPGWNVPSDRVLSISVKSQKDSRFSDLNLDLSSYVKTQDDTLTVYYTSNEQGITYSVPQSGLINSVTYTPSLEDNSLRCAGWPLLSARQPSIQPSSFDSYSDITWADETARLDKFAIALSHDPKLIGYIIVYAGKRACVGEAASRGRLSTKYLVEARGIQENRVKWINGGYREKLTVILHAVPRDAAELTPSPTLKPSEVELLKDCTDGQQLERPGRRQLEFPFFDN